MPTLTAYGHSWVQGAGATSPERRLAAVAARVLGCALRNLGVGGSLSTDTATLVTHEAPPPSELYLLMTGLNDARLHGVRRDGIEAYDSALRGILGACRAASADAVVVVVEQPHLLDYSLHTPHDQGSSHLIDRYNARLRQVARSFPRVVVAPVAGWDARSMLTEDTVHPDDAGHAEIGRAVVEAYRASAPTMAATRPVHD